MSFFLITHGVGSMEHNEKGYLEKGEVKNKKYGAEKKVLSMCAKPWIKDNNQKLLGWHTLNFDVDGEAVVHVWVIR